MMEKPRPVPDINTRPLYPEVVAFGAPRGTRTALRRAADAAGTSVAKLMRDALDHALADQRGRVA